MIKKIFILFLCVCSLIIASAQAVVDTTRLSTLTPKETEEYLKQLDNKDFFSRISNFSELSWASPPAFDVGHHKGIYILSADISPHFLIGGETMPFVVALTPRYKVRIFRDNEKFGDSSLPVRTPSFMPGMTIYFRPGRSPLDVYKNISYWSVSVFHHSNGQDHETFESPGKFNYYNGNFSTNYVELAYTFNFRNPVLKIANDKCVPDSNDCNQCPLAFDRGYSDLVLRAGLEQHFSTAYAQRGNYSRTRLNLRSSWIKVRNWRWRVRESAKDKWKQVGRCYLKESFRIIANANLNLDQLDAPFNKLSRRINADISIHKRIAAGNTAIFGAVGYYGNDPYNIYYSKHYFFLRAGLSLGFFVHASKLSN